MKQPVWDLPVRLVHWLLAALIAFSWWSVESPHRLAHLVGLRDPDAADLPPAVGLRRKLDRPLLPASCAGPRAVVDYLRGSWRGIGHTPLGALSVVALLAGLAMQVGLGLFAQDEDGIYAGPLAKLVSSDTSDSARDIHETWF